MSNVAGFYLGYYGVAVGIPLLVRLVAAVFFRGRRQRSERAVAEARARTEQARQELLERLGVQVAVGTYNGAPMASVFFGESETAREIREGQERWWNGLTDAERAEHLAWEDEQTAMWLSWAKTRTEVAE